MTSAALSHMQLPAATDATPTAAAAAAVFNLNAFNLIYLSNNYYDNLFLHSVHYNQQINKYHLTQINLTTCRTSLNIDLSRK